MIVDYIEPGRMGACIGGVTQARGIAVFLMGPVIGGVIDLCKRAMGADAYRIPFALAIVCSFLAAFLLLKLGRSRFVENT